MRLKEHLFAFRRKDAVCSNFASHLLSEGDSSGPITVVHCHNDPITIANLEKFYILAARSGSLINEQVGFHTSPFLRLDFRGN